MNHAKVKWWSLALASLMALSAWGSDHADAPATIADKDADIADVYAWSDASGNKVNAILTWSPDAAPNSKPSDAVQFVFHFNPSATFGAATATEVQALCTFDTAGQISCWVGDSEYVTGDASARSGLTSASGKLKIFAGVVNDPFFFNLTGFQKVVSTVKAATGLTADAAGCPALDAPTATALATQLGKAEDGSAAKDTFKGKNVRALVMQLDKALITPGGPILGVWASTHRK